MARDEFPTSPRDPRFVETIVGVAAFAALAFYRGLTNTGPTVEEMTLVVLVVWGPAWIARRAARRLWG